MPMRESSLMSPPSCPLLSLLLCLILLELSSHHIYIGLHLKHFNLALFIHERSYISRIYFWSGEGQRALYFSVQVLKCIIFTMKQKRVELPLRFKSILKKLRAPVTHFLHFIASNASNNGKSLVKIKTKFSQ